MMSNATVASLGLSTPGRAQRKSSCPRRVALTQASALPSLRSSAWGRQLPSSALNKPTRRAVVDTTVSASIAQQALELGGGLVDLLTPLLPDGLGSAIEGWQAAFSALDADDQDKIFWLTFIGGSYGLSRPGPIFGFIDLLVLGPLDGLLQKKYDPANFTLGPSIGTGNFGTVYEAYVTKVCP